MKVVLMWTYCSSCGDDEDRFYDDPEKPPFMNGKVPDELQGMVFETVVNKETRYPSTITYVHQEARLDEEGKPFIYKWETNAPHRPTFEEWCKVGFDHQQQEVEGTGDKKHWTFTRQVEKRAWTLDITSIEQLEGLLNIGWELSPLDFSETFGDIQYKLK